MQQSEQLINFFHVGFIICLCLAVIFAIVSIILFFQLRIREVFDFLTGRAQKRTVKQMEEENAKTGKLRQNFYSDLKSSDLYPDTSGRISAGKSVSITEPINSKTDPTEKTVQSARISPNQERNETTLLNSGSEETTLLSSGSGETVLLTPDMEAAIHKETEAKSSIGTFIIIKEQMEIHTQEHI